MQHRLPTPALLALIRIALVAGVLMFGGLTLFIHRQGSWTPMAEGDIDTLRIAGFVIWGIAVGGMILLRGKAGREIDRSRYATLSIVGWALGEAPALFGGVYYFLTANAVWYINGLLLLIASFVIFPIRR